MAISSPSQFSLLDYLSWQLGCEYVSDLRINVPKWRLRCAISSLPADLYPLKQWTDALCYLAVPIPCDTAEQARNALLEQLAESISCQA